MDPQVIAAMARWPDVPDVYGWLSLSGRGEWRLHPQGDALLPEHCVPDAPSPGEAITSPAILQFMNRNYAADAAGQWYFQNGPQKVYVRLDAAPYILHTVQDAAASRLRTHTGHDVAGVAAWWLDDSGKLYALTDLGPALVSGRDLADLLAQLHLADGTPLLDALESGSTDEQMIQWTGVNTAAPLGFCAASEVAAILNFVPCPALSRIAS